MLRIKCPLYLNYFTNITPVKYTIWLYSKNRVAGTEPLCLIRVRTNRTWSGSDTALKTDFNEKGCSNFGTQKFTKFSADVFKKFDLSQKVPPNPVPKWSWIVKLFNYSECWLFEWREKTAWLVAKYEKAHCPKSKAQKSLSRMGQMQRYISGLWSRYM